MYAITQFPALKGLEEQSVQQAPASNTDYLHKYVVYDPEKVKSAQLWKGRMWKTAYSVCVLASLILGLSAYVLAANLSPALGLVCLLVIAIISDKTERITSFFTERRDACYKEVRVATEILEEMATIDDSQIGASLKELGINLNQIRSERVKENLLLLKPLLARYHLCQKQKDRFLEKASQYEPVEIDPFPPNFELITREQEARTSFVIHQSHAARSQIEQAFFLHLLQNPEEEKSQLTDFCTQRTTSNPYISLARSYQEKPENDPFLKVQREGATKSIFTIGEILAADPQTLARQIFGQPATSHWLFG